MVLDSLPLLILTLPVTSLPLQKGNFSKALGEISVRVRNGVSVKYKGSQEWDTDAGASC
jgi:hypothetical protein